MGTKGGYSPFCKWPAVGLPIVCVGTGLALWQLKLQLWVCTKVLWCLGGFPREQVAFVKPSEHLPLNTVPSPSI